MIAPALCGRQAHPHRSGTKTLPEFLQGLQAEGRAQIAKCPVVNAPTLLTPGKCSLSHDPEGAFRLLYYSLALRGLEELPAPVRLVQPDSEQPL